MTLPPVDVVAPWGGRLAVAVIMFCVSLGIDLADLLRTFRRSRASFTGLVLQLLMVPLLAGMKSRLLRLDPVLATGLVLVAACPIRTPADDLARLPGGDVALAVSPTAMTSVLAALTIPWSWTCRVVMRRCSGR